MDEELASLAASAATSVVDSLATDAWEGVRDDVVRLWTRHDPAAAGTPGSELDAARALLLNTGRREARPQLVADWEERFRGLLRAEPAAAEALSRLVSEIVAGAGAGGDAPAAARETTVTRTEMRAEASGRAQIYQAGNNITTQR
ncbi:hypothetical protein ACFVUW_25925 [Streptomyces xiamenensis]|uniref:hypothetical protein n=1 Tax=Streptomyces xiamenensis TaxID=408015 RepID=UPI0036EBE16A